MGSMTIPAAISRKAALGSALLLLSLFAVSTAACEKPDASNTTSPSARALLGTTSGDVSFDPADAPSAPKEPATGWEFELGNARYSKLEDETPAMQVTLSLKSQAGASMEAWLTGASGTIARWKGGNSYTSNGTVCWIFRLTSGTEALQLGEGKQHFTIGFFASDGTVIVSRSVEVTEFTPKLKGSPPGAGSAVFRDLLGCPRGS